MANINKIYVDLLDYIDDGFTLDEAVQNLLDDGYNEHYIECAVRRYSNDK